MYGVALVEKHLFSDSHCFVRHVGNVYFNTFRHCDNVIFYFASVSQKSFASASGTD